MTGTCFTAFFNVAYDSILVLSTSVMKSLYRSGGTSGIAKSIVTGDSPVAVLGIVEISPK